MREGLRVLGRSVLFLLRLIAALLIPLGILGAAAGLVFGAMFLSMRGLPSLRGSEELYQFLCVAALLILGVLFAGLSWLVHHWCDRRLENAERLRQT